jgi:hypothetical protein
MVADLADGVIYALDSVGDALPLPSGQRKLPVFLPAFFLAGGLRRR